MSSDDLTKNLDDHALLLQLVTLFQDFDSRQRDFDSRQRDFGERLQALEDKVDERLHDTRPMWEAVQSQINELREQITEQINELREETEKGFRKLSSKIELLANEVRDLYADERELDRRVRKLESKAS